MLIEAGRRFRAIAEANPVAVLVAEGLTNPQIAQRMFIATGTAKIHVSHIFNKLGLTTRAQLATEVTSRPRTQPKS